jgi:hypothetical protein
VVIGNVEFIAPAGIVTVWGTCAADVLLLCKATSAPPAGAAPVRVTVPVKLFPPTTELRVFVNEDKTGAFTVNVALRVFTYVPEMVTEVFVLTGLLVIGKVAELPPAKMVTLPGTCVTAVLLLCNVTTAPLEGADPLRVTVPVEGFPPTTEFGLTVSENNTAGVTVRTALLVTPYVPDIVTVVRTAMPVVEILNVAVVAPAETVTLDPTWADGSLLESVTTAPPAGAAPLSVTVPVELLPPTTLVGFTVNEESAGGFTVRVAVRVVPNVPEIVTVVEVTTALVVMLKVALEEPATTITLAPT